MGARPGPLLLQPTLGLAAAQTALETIRETLQRDGKTAVAAVADARGELLSLIRLDAAPVPSVLVAVNKAWTAARMGCDTGQLGRDARDGQWDFAFFGDQRYVGWGGGVPVVVDGQVVGAVAVSGLTQEEDECYARDGVAALLRLIGGG